MELIEPPGDDPRDDLQRGDDENHERLLEQLERLSELVARRGSEGPDVVSLRMFVGGSMAVAMILATRVKNFGPIEFYKGLDKLPDLLRAAGDLRS